MTHNLINLYIMKISRSYCALFSALAMAGGFMPAEGRNAVLKELSRNFEFPKVSSNDSGHLVKINNGSSDVNLPSEFADRFLLQFKVDGRKLQSSDNFLKIGETFKVGVENGELKAIVTLCDSLTGESTQIRDMSVAVPVTLLDVSKPDHDIAVYYNGSHFSIYADGRIYDNDFPIGTPPVGMMTAIVSPDIKECSLTTSLVGPKRVGENTFADVQYWTPPFHNAWVGDVATCYANGRYHLFYLLDRRGHNSKFGKGGHYFEHLSSSDLLNWTEHEEATPIEEQWETFGTGTPFEKDGKLYLTYGLHTTRIYPQEQTVLSRIKDDLKQHGATLCIDYDTLTHLIPAGATYSVSEDGGNTFKKSHKIFHYCENPSIWVGDDGKLRMYANYGAKGSWESDNLDGGWRCTDVNFPEGRDCTFPFTFGNYDYVIGGFSGMWRKPKGNDMADFTDISRIGEDCYDGLSVPAVTTIQNGRTLIAGWLKMQNWGGALVIHEMVECSDGVPGTKFVEELIPEFPLIGDMKDGETKRVPESYRYEFSVTPSKLKDGKVQLKFGENTWWMLDLNDDRIQFSSDPEEKSKTLSEGGDVSTAHDYAIPARLKGISGDKKVPVRVVVKYEPKYNGSIIDVEVNGNRSMVSYRPDLKPKEIIRL